MEGDADRPAESEIMALLEGIVVAAEEAQSFIQDDSRISGPEDVAQISDRLMKIRSLTLEIEVLLRPIRSQRPPQSP